MTPLAFAFRFMSFEFGRQKVLDCLRLHYADICSDGDLEIHRAIDALEAGDMQVTCDPIRVTLQMWRSAGSISVDPWH
jgi:hypothetical protein